MRTYLTSPYFSPISTFIAVFVGGVITYLVSRYYYRKAAKDLNYEIMGVLGRIKNVLENDELIIQALQAEGIIDIGIDKQGKKYIILKIREAIHDAVSVKEAVNVALQQPEPDTKPK